MARSTRRLPNVTDDVLPAPYRTAVRRKLLRWYDRNRRDLPWRRRASDPYAQWVAEIMLQQTRVETVLAYYEPFLRRFSTVSALARADHDDVLKMWEGLGYYRRALSMYRAARLLHDQRRGMPDTVEGLRELPGIGEYTAAAIASIAFDRREAAVDGNVARVLARLLGVRVDVLSSEGKTRLRELARQLIPVKRPGDFNQAWMDLGSAICTPKAPACERCPLLSSCVAAGTGQADSLPARNGKRNVAAVRLATAIFTSRGRTLVRQRATGGLWSGLWEFPSVEVASDAVLAIGDRNSQKVSSRGVLDPSNRHSGALDPSDRRGVLDRPDHRGADERPAPASPLNKGGLRGVERSDPIAGALESLAESERVTLEEPPREVGVVTHSLTHRALTFHVFECRVARRARTGANDRRRWITAKEFAKLSVSVAHRKVYALFTS